MRHWLITHRWTMLSILIVVPIGFASKFYRGPAADLVNNSLGGVWYEIFWCLLLSLFFSDLATWKIALMVLGITCALEVLQLWHARFLETIRATFLGRTIIGNSFVVADSFYYIGGSGVGWLWLWALQKKIISPRRRGERQEKQ